MLLAGQLAGILLYPFMETTPGGRALFSVFGIAILGGCARRSSPRVSLQPSTRTTIARGWSCCS